MSLPLIGAAAFGLGSFCHQNLIRRTGSRSWLNHTCQNSKDIFIIKPAIGFALGVAITAAKTAAIAYGALPVALVGLALVSSAIIYAQHDTKCSKITCRMVVGLNLGVASGVLVASSFLTGAAMLFGVAHKATALAWGVGITTGCSAGLSTIIVKETLDKKGNRQAQARQEERLRQDREQQDEIRRQAQGHDDGHFPPSFPRGNGGSFEGSSAFRRLHLKGERDASAVY